MTTTSVEGTPPEAKKFRLSSLPTQVVVQKPLFDFLRANTFQTNIQAQLPENTSDQTPNLIRLEVPQSRVDLSNSPSDNNISPPMAQPPSSNFEENKPNFPTDLSLLFGRLAPANNGQKSWQSPFSLDGLVDSLANSNTNVNSSPTSDPKPSFVNSNNQSVSAPMDFSLAMQLFQQANAALFGKEQQSAESCTFANGTKPPKTTKPNEKSAKRSISSTTAPKLPQAATLLANSPLSAVPAIPGSVAVAASPAAQLFNEDDWSWHRNPAAAIRSGGTNKQTPVWKYFVYNKAENLSRCIVGDCTYMLKGPHTSTLACHLKKHIAEYAEFQKLKAEYSRERSVAGHGSAKSNDGTGAGQTHGANSGGRSSAQSSSSSPCSSSFSIGAFGNQEPPVSTIVTPNVNMGLQNGFSGCFGTFSPSPNDQKSGSGLRLDRSAHHSPKYFAPPPAQSSASSPRSQPAAHPTLSANNFLPGSGIFCGLSAPSPLATMMALASSQMSMPPFPFPPHFLPPSPNRPNHLDLANVVRERGQQRGASKSPQQNTNATNGNLLDILNLLNKRAVAAAEAQQNKTEDIGDGIFVNSPPDQVKSEFSKSVKHSMEEVSDLGLKESAEEFRFSTEPRVGTVQASDGIGFELSEKIRESFALSLATMPQSLVAELLENKFFVEFARHLVVGLPVNFTDIQQIASERLDAIRDANRECLQKSNSDVVLMLDLCCSCGCCWWQRHRQDKDDRRCWCNCRRESGPSEEPYSWRGEKHRPVLSISAALFDVQKPCSKLVLLGIRQMKVRQPISDDIREWAREAVEEVIRLYGLSKERISRLLLSASLDGFSLAPNLCRQTTMAVYPQCLYQTLERVFQKDQVVVELIDTFYAMLNDLLIMAKEAKDPGDFSEWFLSQMSNNEKRFEDRKHWRPFLEIAERFQNEKQKIMAFIEREKPVCEGSYGGNFTVFNEIEWELLAEIVRLLKEFKAELDEPPMTFDKVIPRLKQLNNRFQQEFPALGDLPSRLSEEFASQTASILDVDAPYFDGTYVQATALNPDLARVNLDKRQLEYARSFLEKGETADTGITVACEYFSSLEEDKLVRKEFPSPIAHWSSAEKSKLRDYALELLSTPSVPVSLRDVFTASSHGPPPYENVELIERTAMLLFDGNCVNKQKK